MEIFAGLSVVFLLLAALVVAIKTFRLWLRTRGLPELLLASYLTCATVLGYPLMIAMTTIPATEAWIHHIIAPAITSTGFVCLLAFTKKVFRPTDAWAWTIVGASIVAFVLGGVSYGLEVVGENPRPPSELLTINLLSTVPMAIGYLWTTFEAMAYHARLRRRLQLGLTEAAVVDRVLLWGLMTLAAGVAVLINLVAMLTGSFMTPAVVAVSSGFGFVHAACLFLAFNPPHWYASWVERRAMVEVS